MEECKFKVGDKVVYILGVDNQRGEYVGVIQEINPKGGNYPYHTKFAWGASWFAEHELDLATEAEIKNDRAENRKARRAERH